ncbi:minor capsid protein [Sphaerisporangium sp. NPDC004334]
MAVPTGWTRGLLTGLAQLLAGAGVGEWNEAGAYDAGALVLTIGGLPASADRAITLAVYGLGQRGDDVDQADSSVSVQVRMRGGTDPREVDDVADAVFDVLHGLADRVLATGVLVLLCRRLVVAPMGRDASGRWERADSYDVIAHRPSPHRP